MLVADFKQVRNPAFHRRFFALRNLGFEYWELTGKVISANERRLFTGYAKFLAAYGGNERALLDSAEGYRERMASKRIISGSMSFDAYRALRCSIARSVSINAASHSRRTLPVDGPRHCPDRDSNRLPWSGGSSMKMYDITPIGKPRMSRTDKWKQHPAVLRYRAFCDEARLKKLELPEAGAHVTFVMPMATSWSKKKREQMNEKPHQSKPDCDNMIKALMDALYTDDAHIWDCRITKLWEKRAKSF